jgi:hypothetical protein
MASGASAATLTRSSAWTISRPTNERCARLSRRPATSRYLPLSRPISISSNRTFSKLQARLRKAQERSIDVRSQRIGKLLDFLQRAQCADFSPMQATLRSDGIPPEREMPDARGGSLPGRKARARGVARRGGAARDATASAPERGPIDRCRVLKLSGGMSRLISGTSRPVGELRQEGQDQPAAGLRAGSYSSGGCVSALARPRPGPDTVRRRRRRCPRRARGEAAPRQSTAPPPPG